jgi:uncharacterized protein (TIGR00661 family)
VAPLNWGIGHATRCIPIIDTLLKQGFTPIIASDGEALVLLQKEFPNLKFFELPSYNIRYPENGKWLKWKLLMNIPTIINAIKQEGEKVRELINSEDLIGIISDNRFGVRSSKVPSVYITHQLTVLAGFMTFFATRVHHYYIRKFDECWIPDSTNEIHLSGRLGMSRKISKIKRIGVLSRLKKLDIELKWDLMVLLSGIEPLRGQLEKRLIAELKGYQGKVLFVKGQFEEHQKKDIFGNSTFYNYLLTSELETAINESNIVLSRSGYSTIMDLAKLKKKAFFIPTKGQDEQEYLAKYLARKNITPYSSQDSFKIEMLEQANNFGGFSEKYPSELPISLFNLFKGK